MDKVNGLEVEKIQVEIGVLTSVKTYEQSIYLTKAIEKLVKEFADNQKLDINVFLKKYKAVD